MTDEALQNRSYRFNIDNGDTMRARGSVDEVAGASGSFGRDPRNPIPVNGPIGELVYISNLVLPTGVRVVGHRLGSLKTIDAYELVATDGSRWDILFFDMYHAGKSRRVPSGYSTSPQPQILLLATSSRVPTLPLGMRQALTEATEQFTGLAMTPPEVRDEELFRGFCRPPGHGSALAALGLAEAGRRRSTADTGRRGYTRHVVRIDTDRRRCCEDTRKLARPG